MVSAETLAGVPRGPGVYALVFALAQAATLGVGRSRAERFVAGYYVYVGSALGGLAGRLRRHLGDARRRHWHVDALLDAAPVIEIWYIATGERIECAWAECLRQAPGLAPTLFCFGATDCRCATHLFYSATRPTLAAPGWPGARAIC
jgi:sugar fermentation stimulation protein A